MTGLAIHYNNIFMLQTVNSLNVLAVLGIITFLMSAKYLREAVSKQSPLMITGSVVSVLWSFAALFLNFYIRTTLSSLASTDIADKGIINMGTQEVVIFYIRLQLMFILLSNLTNIGYVLSNFFAKGEK